MDNGMETGVISYYIYMYTGVWNLATKRSRVLVLVFSESGCAQFPSEYCRAYIFGVQDPGATNVNPTRCVYV